MELLAACEDFAANIAAFDFADDDDGSHISDADQSMWQTLFHLSSDEAAKAIRDWRADFTRLTISQAAWLLVKETKTAEGFNKESYEYSLFKAQKAHQKPHASHSGMTIKNDEAKYLVKLECDSDAPIESVQLLHCLPKKPKILGSIDDNGNTTKFCLLDSNEKTQFLDALSKEHSSYQPTLIRVSIAQKNLSPTSLYPTLGIDTTLPQFRPDERQLERNSSCPCSSSSLVRPTQDEYPVWYFFYGTLAESNILSSVIGLSAKEKTIEYKRARLWRGRLSTLAGKYLVLVDADECSVVDGWAYQVQNQDQEDSLRVYETGKYEVVRCTMKFEDDEDLIHGLTFRLA